MEIRNVLGNTYIIDTGIRYIPFYKINNEEIVMMDSGLKEERENLQNLLDENGLRIASLLCSHAHVDHIGNNSYFRERYGCTVAMPEFEAMIARSVTHLKAYYANIAVSDIEERFGQMVGETDFPIGRDQEEITLCGARFGIIHTPGHSPDHICIVTPDDVVYLGDAIISRKTIDASKMPYAFILSEDLLSKRKLYDLKHRKYIVAHKGVYDEITDLITENINFYLGRSVHILKLVTRPMTMEDILKEILVAFRIRVETPKKYVVMERMMRSYVEYLKDTGELELVLENGFLKYTRKTSPEILESR